ncbi:hypothetical protein K503DRAFT_843119 [Rhizopogon vinicolor AM-OR11-026]|uniref:Retroviral polymerase SH3-like domain-containing protein n=1 Tax=Rhizopogon vinicolor AM-OR11-026 TaxID=1314800 RepID=A0A1B7MIX2_9AGAM|nr:hypothetical protein K503DRAFT_843119 [Rhizopogon vinicolor AM-OR11-026]
MEKCVFIGYPQGYKGWKFYNPTTKKTVIAERANFDARHFPLSKCPTEPSVLVPITPTHSLPLPNRPTPSLPLAKTPEAPHDIHPASDHTHSDYESTSEESDSETDDESSSALIMSPLLRNLTLKQMMSPVLMSLWIMGGVLGLQHLQLFPAALL